MKASTRQTFVILKCFFLFLINQFSFTSLFERFFYVVAYQRRSQAKTGNHRSFLSSCCADWKNFQIPSFLLKSVLDKQAWLLIIYDLKFVPDNPFSLKLK